MAVRANKAGKTRKQSYRLTERILHPFCGILCVNTKEVIIMTDAPIGFLMAISQNQSAMDRYSALSKPQRQELIDRAKRASSRREMQQIVDSLAHEG